MRKSDDAEVPEINHLPAETSDNESILWTELKTTRNVCWLRPWWDNKIILIYNFSSDCSEAWQLCKAVERERPGVCEEHLQGLESLQWTAQDPFWALAVELYWSGHLDQMDWQGILRKHKRAHSETKSKFCRNKYFSNSHFLHSLTGRRCVWWGRMSFVSRLLAL